MYTNGVITNVHRQQEALGDGETVKWFSEGDILEYDVRGGDASTDGTRC